MKDYLFKSARLGFRNWLDTDIEKLAAMNADKEVMKFFPSTRTLPETKSFIKRMQLQYAEKGYCYFAVDKLENNEFIGFIGLSKQTYEADFTPCVDIGWRLAKSSRNMGYATEGAMRCLDYAFHNLKLDKIVSTTPLINTSSIQLMKKIGMSKVKNFIHPLILNDVRLRECMLYKINRSYNDEL